MFSGPLGLLRRSKAITLFAFGIVMLAFVVVLGSLIATTTERAGEQHGLDAAAEVHRGVLEDSIWSVLEPSDVSSPLTAEKLVALDGVVSASLGSNAALVAASLADLNGVVLWTDGIDVSPPQLAARIATAKRVSDGQIEAISYTLPLRFDGEFVAVLNVVVDDPDVSRSVGVGSTRVLVLVASAMLTLWLVSLALAQRQLRQSRIETETHRRVALIDPLTGLANRAALTERGDAAIANSSRDGSKVGLVVIDLDQFKAVNDTGGHALGDRVLVEVARRLIEITRRGELALRVGGDEFAVLVSTLTRRNDLEALAHRIRIALNIVVRFDTADDVHVSASVGTASAPRDGDSIAKLFRAADAQMYAEKNHLHSRQMGSIVTTGSPSVESSD